MTWPRSFVHVALAASIAGNILLATKLNTLQSTVSALTARPRLDVGAQLSDLNLNSPAGDAVRVRYQDTKLPTVLYLLSPTCAWCTRNTESVRLLASSVSSRARVIGITTFAATETDRKDPGISAAIASWKELPFPVYTGLSDVAARQLHIRSTPTTVVVSPEGRVLAVWEGAYSGPTKGAVETYFALTLPELTGLPLTKPASLVQ